MLRFDLLPEVYGILEEKMIQDDVEILYVLEKYKFKSRDDLVVLIKKSYEEVDEDGYAEKEFDVRSVTGRRADSSLLGLERELGVLFDVREDGGLDIICKYGDSCDVIRVILSAGYSDYHVVYVTPYNFEELSTGGAGTEYDADLMLKRIVLECVNRKGTDIHFTVHHVNKLPVYKVQYRRNGILCDMDLFQLDRKLNREIISALISRNTNKDTIDLLLADGMTALAPDLFHNKGIELRVAANKVLDGYECVVRIQRTDNVTMTIDHLGFPEDVQDDLKFLAKKQSGITLITGPIRTGKNTTAFAIANEMAKRPIKIKSFESPVEALMAFPQVDYADDPEKLKEAIRLAKKQDINVAFLNEIPNKEVAFAVKDLVNSSVHVVTTMHINRIWHLPYKLYEFYGESYKDIVCQINGIINQKMFGVLCPHCQDRILTSDLADPWKRKILEEYNVTSIGVPQGCKECLDKETGSHGIVIGSNQPYTERLMFTEGVRSALMRCKEPCDMEKVIKEFVVGSRNDLKSSMVAAIAQGRLSVDALDALM